MLKYMSVCNYINEYIKSNHLKSGDKLPTEMEIARAVGVSRITMQKALSELIRQNVIYRVQGSGTYVKNAPKEVSSEVKMIPVVVSHDGITTRTFDIIRGIEAFFDTVSYYVTTHNTNMSADREKDVINQLIGNGFHSMLVLPVDSLENSDLFFDLVYKRQLDIVFIDHLPNQLKGNCVESDNVYGGYLATEHLIDKGYKRIAVISPQPLEQYSTFGSRTEGCINALKRYGIPFKKEYFKVCSPSFFLREAAEELMSLPEPPDAIFALNDLEAIDLLHILTDLGYKVPQDVAIVGYDNLEILTKQPIPLTSIDQNFYMIGYSAASLLFDLMTATEKKLISHKLPVSLVKRHST